MGKPNTSIALTVEELEYITSHWNGAKSAAIHEALRRLMADGVTSDQSTRKVRHGGRPKTK